MSTANGRRIQWAEDVVDNEGLGRKSSKGSFLPPLLAIFFIRNRDNANWGKYSMLYLSRTQTNR